MKKSTPTAWMAAAAMVAAIAASTAHAQATPAQGWQPPRGEMDPSRRVPEPVQEETTDLAGAPQAHAWQRHDAPQGDSHAERRGGFFLGVKGGKGWIYDDVDQTARELNAGYRWQAGAVTLVGVEVAGGKLEQTTKGAPRLPGVDYASIGVNARFNFGHTSRVYALVRAGYMSAESDEGDVDGGYAGVGLGVDVTRNVNLGLTYTNYGYFNEAYWDGGTFYYDADRADTLMLGAEVRF